MRSFSRFGVVSLLAALAAPVVLDAEVVTVSMPVRTDVVSRTSLRVSAQVLEFAAGQPGENAIAVVDFSAGARTQRGGDVVLTVESIRGAEGLRGADERAPTFSGVGEGTASGVLHRSGPSVAARWNGSGLRTGRLTFALRPGARGTHSLPVRFVLSAP